MAAAANLGGGRGGPWRMAAWGAVIALILAIPLVAMQFSRDVNWSPFDFAFAGGLMLAVAIVYEIAARIGSAYYRGGVAAALAAAFLLVWISGAVGVIGNEDNAANLLFLGVLAVAVIGAAVARFRATGMARAMIVTAAAQALVGVIALIAGWGAAGPSYPWDIIGLSGGFTALWLGSAWLFDKATRSRPASA